MIEQLNKLTEDMRNRMRLAIGRAILAAVSDAGAIQTAQADCLADETHDDVERIQEYGFTSVPLPGAEAVLVFPGGNRDHGLIIAVDDRRYRLKALASGEVALYDDLGQYVHLKRNGIKAYSPQNIYMKTDGVLRLEADGVEIHGNTYVQTDVHGKGQRETWAGGNVYNTDTYTTGATGAITEHGLNQPAVPSDHPEA